MKQTQKAISVIQDAGKHIVKTRGLNRRDIQRLTATEASTHSNADMQALAVFSVVLARVTGAQDDGWVNTICRNLGISDARTIECTICRCEVPVEEYYREHIDSHPCE